ncbi:MAG: hypothetical protein JSS75_07245 [Bacteroidetes bacterium]|nr:hypothetical protein [Bacteroidota bacterium]
MNLDESLKSAVTNRGLAVCDGYALNPNDVTSDAWMRHCRYSVTDGKWLAHGYTHAVPIELARRDDWKMVPDLDGYVPEVSHG